MFVGLRTIYYWLARVLVCEPLFKAYCTEHGRNLRTGAHVHWVTGVGELFVGDDAWIYGKSSFLFTIFLARPPRLMFGDRVRIGHGCIFRVADSISVGNDCIFSADVFIYDNPGHAIDPQLRLAHIQYEGSEVKPITIGNNVWIGARTIICPGVTIGDNSIVAGGSVVMTNVAANSIVSGNPARKVGGFSPSGIRPIAA
jgi:serine acetyltransferase